VFVNSSNINNPIGIIAGLTAPSTLDRAANKWYVDSKIPKLCFYNVNVGGAGASFNSTTASPTFGTLTPGLYMIIINGTARDIASQGNVGYTIQGLGTGGTPSYNVFTRYPGDPSAYQPLTLGAYVQVGTGSGSGFTVTSYSDPVDGNPASIYIASIVATRISD
jgi:hypothetical protein